MQEFIKEFCETLATIIDIEEKEGKTNEKNMEKF